MSTEHSQRDRKLARSLLIFNGHVMGITVGLISTLGLFIATVILLVQGTENPGAMLGQLAYFLPGYSISFGGALIGSLFAGIYGYVGGGCLGLLYGRWMLRAPTRSLYSGGANSDPTRTDGLVVLLNPLPLAIVCGALMALGLVIATDWLSLRHEATSYYLSLLVHYLPGYRPTLVGSLFGALGMFGYGFVAAGSAALIYNRVVALRYKVHTPVSSASSPLVS